MLVGLGGACDLAVIQALHLFNPLTTKTLPELAITALGMASEPSRLEEQVRKRREELGIEHAVYQSKEWRLDKGEEKERLKRQERLKRLIEIAGETNRVTAWKRTSSSYPSAANRYPARWERRDGYSRLQAIKAHWSEHKHVSRVLPRNTVLTAAQHHWMNETDKGAVRTGNMRSAATTGRERNCGRMIENIDWMLDQLVAEKEVRKAEKKTARKAEKQAKKEARKAKKARYEQEAADGEQAEADPTAAESAGRSEGQGQATDAGTVIDFVFDIASHC